MSVTRIVPPAKLPVSVEEQKAFLRIAEDYTAEDAVVAACLASATAIAEQITGRALITQTWRATFDAFPDSALELPRLPVQSIASLTYAGADGVAQTVDAADYALVRDDWRARIVRGYGVTWATPRAQYDAVTVTWVAGYGDDPADVPEPLRTAIMMMAAHMFENRQDVMTGPGSAVVIPQTSQWILQLYSVPAM